MRDALADEILQQVKELSDKFFERLVVQLLVAMGYGGSIEDAGKAVGKRLIRLQQLDDQLNLPQHVNLFPKEVDFFLQAVDLGLVRRAAAEKSCHDRHHYEQRLERESPPAAFTFRRCAVGVHAAYCRTRLRYRQKRGRGLRPAAFRGPRSMVDTWRFRRFDSARRG